MRPQQEPKFSSDPDTLWPEVEVYERTLHAVRRIGEDDPFLVEGTEAEALAYVARNPEHLEYLTATETTVVTRTPWKEQES